MIATVVIISFSLALLVYWFWCSCALILDSSWNEEQARAIADQNELSFRYVEERLAGADTARELDRIEDLLEQDLKTVLALMARCDSLREDGPSLESQMLRVYAVGLKLRFAVERTIAGTKAGSALREKSRIVAYLAGELGEHMAAVGA